MTVVLKRIYRTHTPKATVHLKAQTLKTTPEVAPQQSAGRLAGERTPPPCARSVLSKNSLHLLKTGHSSAANSPCTIRASSHLLSEEHTSRLNSTWIWEEGETPTATPAGAEGTGSLSFLESHQQEAERGTQAPCYYGRWRP